MRNKNTVDTRRSHVLNLISKDRHDLFRWRAREYSLSFRCSRQLPDLSEMELLSCGDVELSLVKLDTCQENSQRKDKQQRKLIRH